VILFLLCLSIYSCVLATVSFGHFAHASWVLLPFRYLVLLPAAVFFLHSSRDPQASRRRIQIPAARFLIGGFFVVTMVLGWWTKDGIVISDESAYRFQAKIFSTGRLWANSLPGATSDPRTTPEPIFFAHHIQAWPRWFTKYPPGWPLLLALPERLHLGWALCPALSAVLLLLTAQLGRTLFDNQTTTVAVFMAVLSPYFLANCIGYMSHVSCAVLLVGACLLYLQGLKTSSEWQLAGGFALLVYACLTRPLTGLVMLGVFVLFGLVYTRGNLRAMVVGIGIASLLIAIGLTLIDNRVYTGFYWLSPYAWSRGLQVPKEVTLHPRLLLHNLLFLTRWSLEGTVLYTFPFAFLLGAYAVIRDWKTMPAVRLLAVLFPAIVIAHVVQTEPSASRIGERYYFEAVFAVVLLAARGLILLTEKWRPSRQAILALFFGLASVQLLHQIVVANSIRERTYPFRANAEMVDRLPQRPFVVFFSAVTEATPSLFVPEFFNRNSPRWETTTRAFLNDPGPEERAAWACSFQREEWVVIGFDENRKTSFTEFGGLKSRGPGDNKCPAPH
jgi:hypothetical protein